jgi:putative DNA primase/helicase
MSDLPNLSPYCKTVALKLWGKPQLETPKQMRWSANNGNGYGSRTLNPLLGQWYDRGAGRGGSTLELIAYAKGLPNEKIRGQLYWDMRRALDELNVGAPKAPEKKSKRKGNADDEWPPIRATFPYPDENNNLLFQVVRFDTNDPHLRFRQRQPDGKGGWIWNLKGVRRVPYGLPALIAAIAAKQLVLITEGEKDANTAMTLGFAATTMPEGINKWRADYDQFFIGADVVIVSDNDPQLKDPKTGKLQFHADGRPMFPGQDHAAKLAKRLAKVAAHVRVITFETVKDLTEWVESGGTREQLDAIIAQAPEQIKQQPEEEEEPKDEEPKDEEPKDEEPPIDADAEIERLMALSDLEYEQQKKGAAKKLGVSVSYLDRLRRAEQTQAEDGKQGHEISFSDIEPWPHVVVGAALLEDIANAIRTHVVMPDHCRDACALWIVHSYLIARFFLSPRLGVCSPVKGCGKTLLLEILGRLVPRPLPTQSVTPSAIFRVVEAHRPSLLIDEADTFLYDNDDLRGILNGNRKGSTVLRTVGDEHQVRAFSVYTAVAIALIGRLPDTLHDRAVTVELQRRRANETITPFRPDRADHLDVLARKIARWVKDHADRIAERDPELKGIINREADNWRPLLAIADEAAGEWPKRGRAAAEASHTSDMDEGSRLELVLGDIRTVFAEQGTKLPDIFGVDQVIISSAKLIKALIAIEGHPWEEMGKAGKPLTKNKLARMLKPLGIVPGMVGPENARLRGYKLSQFEEAFSRYLLPEGDSNRPSVQPSEKSKTYDDSKPYSQDDGCTVAKSPNPLETLTTVRMDGCEEGMDANASAQPSNASAEQQESAPEDGPSSDPAPEKISLSRVDSKVCNRTASRKQKRDDAILRGTSSDPVYTGPAVDVPDQGSDPLDQHGRPRAATPAAPPLTPGHVRELHRWSLDWVAAREAANLDVTTAGLEAELRTVLRQELALDEVEAAIAQVMELVFAV